MTIARRIVALLTASLAFVGAAEAGAPKSLQIADIVVTHRGSVHLTMTTPGARSALTLAQVMVSPRLRLGRSCRGARGDRAVGDIVLELGLNRAARASSDPKAKDRTSYVFQADGTYDSPKRSLNLLLVERGLARVTSAQGVARRAFAVAQRRAKRAHRGLWGCRR